VEGARVTKYAELKRDYGEVKLKVDKVKDKWNVVLTVQGYVFEGVALTEVDAVEDASYKALLLAPYLMTMVIPDEVTRRGDVITPTPVISSKDGAVETDEVVGHKWEISCAHIGSLTRLGVTILDLNPDHFEFNVTSAVLRAEVNICIPWANINKVETHFSPVLRAMVIHVRPKWVKTLIKRLRAKLIAQGAQLQLELDPTNPVKFKRVISLKFAKEPPPSDIAWMQRHLARTNDGQLQRVVHKDADYIQKLLPLEKSPSRGSVITPKPGSAPVTLAKSEDKAVEWCISDVHIGSLTNLDVTTLKINQKHFEFNVTSDALNAEVKVCVPWGEIRKIETYFSPELHAMVLHVQPKWVSELMEQLRATYTGKIPLELDPTNEVLFKRVISLEFAKEPPLSNLRLIAKYHGAFPRRVLPEFVKNFIPPKEEVPP